MEEIPEQKECWAAKHHQERGVIDSLGGMLDRAVEIDPPEEHAPNKGHGEGSPDRAVVWELAEPLAGNQSGLTDGQDDEEQAALGHVQADHGVIGGAVAP